MKQITIFTPTYNRAHMLPRLYQSLCEQNSDDFVWLVIDDGSTDNTQQLLAQWEQEAKVAIRFFRQENGGKMRAHNRGVELCDTELFVCIDSDDYLASPHAVAEVLAYWQDNADITQRDDICGIVSYKKMEKHNQTTFPDGLRTSTLTALYEQGFNGETTLVFKTNILRHYPFPVAEGEKFVTETIVYDMLDQHYELLLFRHYTQICEYQADGYTANGMDVMLKNPKGYRNYYNQLVALGKGNKRYHAQMYIALSLFIGDGKTLAIASKKWFTMLCMPMGIYQYWKLKRRKW